MVADSAGQRAIAAMGRRRTGWFGRGLLTASVLAALAGPAVAQSSPPAAATPPAATPTTPALTSPAPTTPPPPTPAPPAVPSTGAVTQPDTSISQTLDVPARPALILSGKSTWDDGFKTITAAFAKLNEALAKNSIAGGGHPLAVFTETDDTGFSFSAEIPLDKAPDGKVDLAQDVKIGETPSGKAMRFQHRGSYEEIDSTYEAITAYLDEKGLEARNLFAEEYLAAVKTPDDSALQVDIYVFLK